MLYSECLPTVAWHIQDHLINHQRAGVEKSVWTKDSVMRGLLSHPAVWPRWRVLAEERMPHLDYRFLLWTWENPAADRALSALEHKPFENSAELERILELAIQSAKTDPLDYCTDITGLDVFFDGEDFFRENPGHDI